MMPRSCLYVGRVVHRRTRPRRHHLSYRCYWLLVDIDALEALSGKLRLFSLNRFNLFSIKNQDHGDGSPRSSRAQARHRFNKSGIDTDGCRIFLLTMPRVLGYAFNPLSVYFCYRPDGELVGVAYEVHNTYGERHSYVISTEASTQHSRHACAKGFYVSPFLEMHLRYDFDLAAPGDDVRVAIRASDAEGPLLMASLSGRREELSDWSLAKVFFGHPLITLKVTAAIHWQALRLWLKGVPLVARPDASAEAALLPVPSATKAMHE